MSFKIHNLTLMKIKIHLMMRMTNMKIRIIIINNINQTIGTIERKEDMMTSGVMTKKVIDNIRSMEDSRGMITRDETGTKEVEEEINNSINRGINSTGNNMVIGRIGWIRNRKNIC